MSMIKQILLADLIWLLAMLPFTLGIPLFLAWRRRRAMQRDMNVPGPPPDICRHCVRCHAVRDPGTGVCVATGYCAKCRVVVHE
jgi:hypothetical protein